MPTFTNDPVISHTTTKDAISVLGESAKNEGVRGISHNARGGVVGINDWSPPAPPGAGGNGGWFESTQGEGVRGWAKTPHHAGVVGVNNDGGIGVFGQSDTQAAVVGESKSGNGGTFESNLGEGVRGVSNNPSHGGVVGVNTAKGIAVFGTSEGEGVHGETTAQNWVAGVTGLNLNGIGPGVLGQANGSGPGVFGSANKDAGVVGFHGNPHLEETLARQDGATAGVFGASDVGAGVVGYSRSGNAGKFDGNVDITGNLTVRGDIFIPGADCAEQFELAEADAGAVEAGSVLVIDDSGGLRRSAHPYDTKVAGVVSGAGRFKPGIVLDASGQTQENRRAVALMGKVYCKVDAEHSPISVGDLLTTSNTLGHAMKATEPGKAFGAVLGKSLGSLESGKGLLPILVCLG